MTFEQYQNLAARTIDPKLTSKQQENHALHEIASEVGEIHDLYQKEIQGHPMMLHRLILEMGDVLWGLAELATSLGVSMEDVAQSNIRKLRERYPDGFSTERSINRKEYQQ